jgi:hypothetical protein
MPNCHLIPKPRPTRIDGNAHRGEMRFDAVSADDDSLFSYAIYIGQADVKISRTSGIAD